MFKFSSILLLVFGVMSCTPLNEPVDYFGQPYPNSIPQIFAPDIISIKGRFEHGISFSPDTQEVVFGILNKDDSSGEIYYSKKTDQSWLSPITFEPLKNKSVYLPYFTPDGNSLLYAQSNPDTINFLTDIYKIEKTNATWSTPKKIETPISSSSREANASMTVDGTIYFSSNRNCEGKENCYSADLFYSKLIGNKYQSAQAIPEFISTNDEESLFISPEEDYILFCRHTDNETWMDLYISYRDSNNKWLEPQLLDSSINSKDWDRRPFVTMDNNFLFFTRLQIGESGLTESDIYWVNTSKIFKPFVYNAIPDKALKVDKEFKLSIPTDYFKDIDDTQLTIRVNQAEFDWLTFDKKSMTLSGLPTEEGTFDVTFTATDKFANTIKSTVKLTVTK